MKKSLLLCASLLLSTGAMMAQSAIDIDFESQDLSAWTQYLPEGHTGGYTVVAYSETTSLKPANVGANDLGGEYCLQSLTGGKNKVKANSDNWFISPKVAITAEQNVLSFRFAANCSYSPSKKDAEKMQMQLLISESSDTATMTTVLATLAPENYAAWRQYSFDLSAYEGKDVYIAFHDFGQMGSGALGDMKYIDNITLAGTKSSDYAVTAATTLHGQAELNPVYTLTVANYGLSKGSFTANYQINDGEVVSETVPASIAAGETMEYTFQQSPVFNPADTVVVRTWISAADDAFASNDSVAEATVGTAAVAVLPYSLGAEDVASAFSTLTSKSSKANWAYDPDKYQAWIFSQLAADDKYVGISYLYTNDAITLPQGLVKLTTIGTATLTDMTYEVYVAKYAATGMAEYADSVGVSDTLRNVVETETIDTTVVNLNIPEAGEYIVAIRPITHLKNAQMTIIGFSLEAESTTAIANVENRSAVLSRRIYDLNGRQVATPGRGLYIIDGKKVIVK